MISLINVLYVCVRVLGEGEWWCFVKFDSQKSDAALEKKFGFPE